MTYYLCAALLFIFFFAPIVVAEEQDPSLIFQVSNHQVRQLSLSEMKSKLKAREIELIDPLYGKKKRYEGFSLRDVIELGFGDTWRASEYTEMAFAALDGYEAVSDISKIKETGGYLVFKDLDVPSWEGVGNRQQSPGPFYLLWIGEGQTTQNEYLWPSPIHRR